MDKRKQMDWSATGEVILEAGNPRQPYWEHWGCPRIKKGSGLSRPFIEEQPRGDPLSCRQRLQTAPHQKTQKTASDGSSLGQEVTPGTSIVYKRIYPARAGLPCLEFKTELPRPVLPTPMRVEQRPQEARTRGPRMVTLSHPIRRETLLSLVLTDETSRQGTALLLLLTQKITFMKGKNNAQ